MENKKIILIIMDGWGIGKIKERDVIQNADVPFVNSLYTNYPNTTLITCGLAVGLPEGQMGNSEVGHLNLGAGRIVYQDLERINVSINNKSFNVNPALLNAINYCKKNGKTLHLLGLVSNGGVHSHLNHLKAITQVCSDNELSQVRIHAFTDGRDTDPRSGIGCIQDLRAHLAETTGEIATITGRYYAMDRDKRWERIKICYDALVTGIGEPATDLIESIKHSYNRNITDEFILPIINSGIHHGKIEDGDAVLCFNFRTDRCREITHVLSQANMPEAGMHKLSLHFTTMSNYDDTFLDIDVMYDKDNLENTLGEVISAVGKTQLRIAETEKYPHVSFFFSGGRETNFPGEKRVMVPSPKVATYDLKPSMSAYELTEAVVKEIIENAPDFICLNFANADMVGHTGVWNAVREAVETVDKCVEKVVTVSMENNYTVFLTADHGNADYEINDDGTPNTAHSLNPVPLFIMDKNWKGQLKPGKLGDIAPTILTMMNLPIPKEMTGNVLI